jgi:bifunctional UDP-N-acetylglucosamine pyrophosphorylase / glucosamine-1-phosphate N-acetyltransferase
VSTNNTATIVLAAGRGTRMRSTRAKVLHEVGGEPMIVRVLRALGDARRKSPVVVVVGYQAGEVESFVRGSFPDSQIRFAVQSEQRGTGDALRTALTSLPADFDGSALVLYGDVPMVSESTLTDFSSAIDRKGDSGFGLITVKLADGASFGRVIRGKSGQVDAIVEARDASPAELAVDEINTGIYYFPRVPKLRTLLAELKPNNAQGEYYLTDLVAIARAGGARVEAWIANEPAEFANINSREELAEMEAQIRAAVNRKLMEAGVTLVDPATAYISEQAEISPDCVIGPAVQILGKCKLGEGVRIDGTAWLSNVTIGPRCHLKLGVRAEDCVIGEDSEIGPFANLRAGTELAGHNRIGNFVETKKARIGRGTKASHLSYLGDATIGADTNVGCGVITVNYDGYDKHQTVIGDRCMVGCDTQLVAPVKVGNDVYVASGTTILREVPDGALVMSHHPQREKSGWTATWRKRHGD